MPELFANSGDPDQMLHSAVSDLGLHCLPSTLLRVSRQQWVSHVPTQIFMVNTTTYVIIALPPEKLTSGQAYLRPKI